MADVTELDATAVVDQLLAAAGSRLYDSWLTEFERLSDIGCDLLFAVRDRPGDVPIGARTAHPRDVVEDVWLAFVHPARRWPDRFLEHVLSDPALHDDIEILDALGEVDRRQHERSLSPRSTSAAQATLSAASTPSDR